MKDFVLALDQGTTSSRALVFDRAGGVVALAQREFRQIFPRPGWVEHDPEEIWATQLDCAREAIKRASLNAQDIAAIGITNQRETTIVWERATGRPVANAIVWQDRRTAAMCDALKARGLESMFQERTGLLLDAYFSGTKLKWILDQLPDGQARAQRGTLAFGTVDSWLIWKLTGGRVHATDASNASRTLLYDLHTLGWNHGLLRTLAIPQEVLPIVYETQGLVSETDALGAPIPIAGVAGDQQAALFGQMCVREGMAKNTYGTGCFLLMNVGARALVSRNRLLTTVAWQREGAATYALEGSVFVAGAAVQWLRDGLGIISESAEVETLAASVVDSGGVFLVPAFTGLGAPHWDAYARGALLGLTRGTGKGHLARAALEAIALQSAEVLEAMQADANVALQELRVDGGASRNDLLMQIQADVLGVQVARPRITETTALGAAYLAGLAVGVWRDLAELERQWQVDRVFHPRAPQSWRNEIRAGWTKAVARAKSWAVED